MARTLSPCTICKETDPTMMHLPCANQDCRKQTHRVCLDFTVDEANAIKVWYCEACQDKGHRIKYRHNQAADGPDVAPTAGRARSPIILRISRDNSGNLSGSSGPPSVQPPAPRGESELPMDLTSSVPEDLPGPSNEESHLSDSTDTDVDEEAEHTVKDIINVRHGKEEDEYLIVWEDDSTSWEPQSGIGIGCEDLITKIRDTKKFPKINFTSTFGAAGPGRFNPANWRTIDDVIEAVDKFDRRTNNFLPVEKFSSSLKNGVISIIGLRKHMYVVYKSPFTGTVYLADGYNWFIEDEEVQQAIRNILGLTPVAIRFVGQSGIDHCASSAVMIALSYRNAYRAKMEPITIKAERDRMDRIRRSFHPFQTETLPAPQAFRNVEPDICSICGKEFKSRNRQKYFGHLRGHQNKGRKAT